MIDYGQIAHALLLNNASSDDIEAVTKHFKDQGKLFDENELYQAIETHPLSLNDEGKITNANQEAN